jgi:hypothetical protein
MFIFCMSLFADGVLPIGSGTETDPYQINTLDNLLWLSTNSDSWDSYFIQTADIDASSTVNWNNGEGFEPIGRDFVFFNGNYQGQNYEITGIYINRPQSVQQAFFGYIGAGTVQNLHLSNCNVTGEEIVGGLIGWLDYYGEVLNCSVEGIVSGVSRIGGFIGVVKGGHIDGCSSFGTVSNNEYSFTGGFVGSDDSSTISNSFNSAVVNGMSCSGGFAGFTTNSQITDCYNLGTVNGHSNVGGFAGKCGNSVLVGCFNSGDVVGNAHFGGVVGHGEGLRLVNSYYDYETVLINGQHLITLGALETSFYNEWLNQGRYLDINDYLVEVDGVFQLNSITDFNLLRAFGQGEHSFSLNTDLDFTNLGMLSPYFEGVFYGNGNTISNVVINDINASLLGLFGYVVSSEISDLMLEDCSVNGNTYLGILTGETYSTNLTNIYCRGQVTGTGFSIGGLVGLVVSSIFQDCYSDVVVSGSGSTGGLVGYTTNSEYNRCSSKGSVTALSSGAGGFYGDDIASDFFNCHSGCSVAAPRDAGGFAGGGRYSIYSNCYSSGSVSGDNNVGGFQGYDGVAYVTASFWCTETSGQATSACSFVGLTTQEMQTESTFTNAGWDFVGETVNGTEDIWSINPDVNNGFPYFAQEAVVDNDEHTIPVQPEISALIGNYPNPFNPETTVMFTVAKSGNVDLSIYNLKGQRIRTLTDQKYQIGEHSIVWNGKDDSGKGVGSGIYFYRLVINNLTVSTKKCILMK